MKKRSYWVLWGVMVLVGAFLMVFLGSQNRLPVVTDVNAQMNGMDSSVSNGYYSLGNLGSYESHLSQFPSDMFTILQPHRYNGIAPQDYPIESYHLSPYTIERVSGGAGYIVSPDAWTRLQTERPIPLVYVPYTALTLAADQLSYLQLNPPLPVVTQTRRWQSQTDTQWSDPSIQNELQQQLAFISSLTPAWVRYWSDMRTAIGTQIEPYIPRPIYPTLSVERSSATFTVGLIRESQLHLRDPYLERYLSVTMTENAVAYDRILLEAANFYRN